VGEGVCPLVSLCHRPTVSGCLPPGLGGTGVTPDGRKGRGLEQGWIQLQTDQSQPGVPRQRRRRHPSGTHSQPDDTGSCTAWLPQSLLTLAPSSSSSSSSWGCAQPALAHLHLLEVPLSQPALLCPHPSSSSSSSPSSS